MDLLELGRGTDWIDLAQNKGQAEGYCKRGNEIYILFTHQKMRFY
jgi:hypothetical protein